MRRLDRTSVTRPTCLAKYKHGREDWSVLTKNKAHYQDVCAALAALQGARCAYCETDLSRESDRPHVEHYRQRGRNPARTFDWENLFWSCSHTECCGKYKDQGAGPYTPRDVAKPDEEEPRKLLFFASDGSIQPRMGLSATDEHRARETIRVFALDCPRLRGTRRSYLTPLASEVEDALSAGFSEGELDEHRRIIAADYAQLPFTSAVLDLLGL